MDLSDISMKIVWELKRQLKNLKAQVDYYRKDREDLKRRVSILEHEVNCLERTNNLLEEFYTS